MLPLYLTLGSKAFERKLQSPRSPQLQKSRHKDLQGGTHISSNGKFWPPVLKDATFCIPVGVGRWRGIGTHLCFSSSSKSKHADCDGTVASELIQNCIRLEGAGVPSKRNIIIITSAKLFVWVVTLANDFNMRNKSPHAMEMTKSDLTGHYSLQACDAANAFPSPQTLIQSLTIKLLTILRPCPCLHSHMQETGVVTSSLRLCKHGSET